MHYNLKRLKQLKKEELYEVKDALIKMGHYKRLMPSKKAYPKKQEFENWLENQDLPGIAKVLSRLAVLAETKVYLFWKNPNLQA